MTPLKLPGFSLDLSSWETKASPSPLSPEIAWKNFLLKTESKQIGFFNWPEEALSDLKASQEIAQTQLARFDAAIVFGIGGSYLGPYAISRALAESAQPFPIHWVSNTDAAAIREATAFAKKYRCASIVISKSGGTVETLSAFFHLSHALDPSGYVMVTDPSVGELRRLAKENGWKSLTVPPNIGGRFSVLTSVGLLPLALLGFSNEGLVSGAKEMRKRFLEIDPRQNPAVQFASRCEQSFRDHKNIHCLMPYEARLKPLGDWFVQLWAESLGKATLKNPKTSTGFTPIAALGTSDQHSILQLLREGPSDKVVGFLSVAPSASEETIKSPHFRTEGFDYLARHSFEKVTREASSATQKSLSNGHVPTYRIELDSVSEHSLGAFLFFMETACAVAGEIFDVDAFNQPGVEEAKRLLKAALA